VGDGCASSELRELAAVVDLNNRILSVFCHFPQFAAFSCHISSILVIIPYFRAFAPSREIPSDQPTNPTSKPRIRKCCIFRPLLVFP
jgi:hypothetical protein